MITILTLATWPRARRTAHRARRSAPSGTRTPCSMHTISIPYSNGTQYRQSVRLLAAPSRRDPAVAVSGASSAVQGRVPAPSASFWRSCEIRRGFRRRRRRGFRGSDADSGAGSGAGDATRSGAFGAGAGARGAGAVASYGRRSRVQRQRERLRSARGEVGAGACLRPHVVRVRSLPRQSVYTAMRPVPLLCVKSEAELRHVGCAPRAAKCDLRIIID